MIDSQIKRQRAANIKTEVLLRQDIFDQLSDTDNSLFEARPTTLGALVAQIIIYGDNIAITTFRSGVVTTIITSTPIADTFRQLFANQWDHSVSSDT